MVYAANMTETPRSLTCGGVFSNNNGSGNASYSYKDGGVSIDRPATIKELEIIVPDPSKVYSASGMVESKSVGTFSVFQKQDSHRGLFVDRGVGSPRLAKSASSTIFTIDLKPDSEAKNPMPAAAGAIAAAAVADQMLGPKEDRHLAIVLNPMPAAAGVVASFMHEVYMPNLDFLEENDDGTGSNMSHFIPYSLLLFF